MLVSGGLKSHSKKLLSGDIFYVLGDNFCVEDYLPEVLAKNPSEIVVPNNFVAVDSIIPIRHVHDVRRTFREDCQRHYQELFEAFQLWGVTGTKGKTTISWGLYQFLISQGINAAYVGTLGIESKKFRQDPLNTTPGLADFIEILQRLHSDGVTHVICEISSQGLIQERVPIPYYQVRAFTDLSEEHLDAHGNMEEYFIAKKQFFLDQQKLFTAFILDRSSWGNRLADSFEGKTIRYGLASGSFPSTEKLTDDLDGISINLEIDGRIEQIYSPWLGFFNAENLLCIISILLNRGFSLNSIREYCKRMPVIAGRLEQVASYRGARVYVDYAHSSQSLEFLLEVMHKHTSGRLHVLFGCGGQRDPSKRPRMAKACSKWADRIVVTQDNPRSEDPEEIIRQILSGFSAEQVYEVESDRGKAITKAIRELMPGDILLVVGKGHEDYQIIGSRKLPFSDSLEIKKSVLRLEEIAFDERASVAVHHSDDFIRVTKGVLLQGGKDLKVDGFHFDSRKISKGQCFVALRGAGIDGHGFVDSAFANGASWVLGSEQSALNEIPRELTAILHKNPREALLVYANFYRSQSPALIIGITGSCGKTTTKDCLKALLGKETYANPGNFNNDLGLPISILGMPQNVRYGVFELGINAPGEMTVLSQCLSPDIALITNIDQSHREFFPERSDLIREKLSIASHMKPGSLLFVAKDLVEEVRPIYAEMGYGAKLLPLEFSNLHSHHAEALDHLSHGPYQSLLMASALARQLGVRLEDRIARIRDIVLSPLRMEVRKTAHSSWVLDCYNASPRSMRSFLYSFELPSKTVLVLGDMLELGDDSLKHHEEILSLALDRAFKKIILMGEQFRAARKSLGDSDSVLADNIDIAVQILRNLRPAEIGLKGSRMFALERIFDKVEERSC